MRIIAVSQLKAFWEQYPDAEQPLLAWVDEARKAEWTNPRHSCHREGPNQNNQSMGCVTWKRQTSFARSTDLPD